MYLGLHLYSPKKQGGLYNNLTHWSQLNGYGFNECITKMENSTNIGWLVYSSQFTDIDHLNRYMEKDALKVEWGFKLGAITNADIFQDEKKME